MYEVCGKLFVAHFVFRRNRFVVGEKMDYLQNRMFDYCCRILKNSINKKSVQK